jgi:hypothetical protein
MKKIFTSAEPCRLLFGPFLIGLQWNDALAAYFRVFVVCSFALFLFALLIALVQISPIVRSALDRLGFALKKSIKI